MSTEKGIEIFNAVTEINDDIIEQAADYKFRKSPMRFIKPAGIAASLALVALISVFALNGGFGGKNTPEAAAGDVTSAVSQTSESVPTDSSTSQPVETTVPAGETKAPAQTKDNSAAGDVTSAVSQTSEPVPTDSSTSQPAETTVPAGETTAPAQTKDNSAAGDVPAGSGQNREEDGDNDGDDAAPVTVPPGGYPTDENPHGGGEGIELGLYLRGSTPPAFPLTAVGDTSGITAERELTFDLSDTGLYAKADDIKWDEKLGRYTARDTYTLTNTTGEDKTLTLLVPFKSSLSGLEGDPYSSTRIPYMPAITVNGSEIKPGFAAGDYSGKFRSAGYPGGADRSNFDEDANIDYPALFADSSYLKDALAEAPKIDEPVVVYRIHDYGTTLERGKLRDNMTIAVSFRLNGTSKQIMSFGFNGSFSQGNTRTMTFGVPVEGFGGEHGYFGDRYIIIRGGDISDITLKGYKNGLNADFGDGTDFSVTGDGETPEIYGEIERLEMDLGDILPKMIMADIASYWNLEALYASYRSGVISEKEICDTILKYMCRYGSLAEDPIERYGSRSDFGMMIQDAANCMRVIYAKFEVTVPAGGSVTVSAERSVLAPIYSENTTGELEYGLEMYPTLGTSLDITSQTVNITDAENIVVTDQNFGLDDINGALTGEVDSSEEMWFVRITVKQ